MAKYLQEIEIIPSNHYGHLSVKKIIEETRCILFALNKSFKRNVYITIINVPAKLVFINDQLLEFRPKDNFFETVTIDLTL